MRENLLITARGQITLPTALRKRYGIRPGDVIILEERDGEILLKPAAVVEVDAYSDERIAAWDEADRFAPGERAQLLERLRGGQ
jgi:antitoxin PrlF